MTPCPMVAPNSANSTNLKLYFFPKDSFNGFVEVFPSLFAFLNSGDSSIFLRMKYDTTTITDESKNGNRHPHSSNASADMLPLVSIMTAREINSPKVAVVCIHDVR